jgi:hydrogenase expression/formation protein HypC
MCLGIPMTVIETDATSALCRSRSGDERRVSTMLVGDVTPGTCVLVHIDSAVRILEAGEAERIADALEGLAAALDGRSFDHLFADLIDREPQLPEHLR